MRILITKEGKIIMNEIEDLPNQYKTERIFYKNKFSLKKIIIKIVSFLLKLNIIEIYL